MRIMLLILLFTSLTLADWIIYDDSVYVSILPTQAAKGVWFDVDGPVILAEIQLMSHWRNELHVWLGDSTGPSWPVTATIIFTHSAGEWEYVSNIIWGSSTKWLPIRLEGDFWIFLQAIGWAPQESHIFADGSAQPPYHSFYSSGSWAHWNAYDDRDLLIRADVYEDSIGYSLNCSTWGQIKTLMYTP